MLDLSSLIKAIKSLKSSLRVAGSTGKRSKEERDTIKAGVIQTFEFTYELCWKFLKRYLGNNLGKNYIDGVSRRELFRLGAENHLIKDVGAWMEYHDQRNETAHTYDEATAEKVFAAAKKFSKDAEDFLSNLKKRNA